MNELWTKPARFHIDSGDELLTFTRAVPLPAVLLVSLTSAGCSDIVGGLVCTVLPFVLILLAMFSGKNKPPRSGKRNSLSPGAVVAGGEGYVGGDCYGYDVGGGDCGGDSGGGGDGGGGGGGGGGDGGC